MKTFTLRRILSQAILIIGVILFSAGLQTYAASFAQPTQSAPNGDAVAPLDTGANLNIKAGGLLLNNSIGPAPNGLIVASGNVGIGTLTPAGKLDVEGGNLCLNGSCIGSWPVGGTGTITGVTAGTGLTGGGTSGNVTLSVMKIPVNQCPFHYDTQSTCVGQLTTNTSCADLTCPEACGWVSVTCSFSGYYLVQ